MQPDTGEAGQRVSAEVARRLLTRAAELDARIKAALKDDRWAEAIGKAEDAIVEFEGDVDVHAVFALVGTLQQLLRVSEPEKLAVEFEMHGQQAAVQDEKNIFTLALDRANAAALRMAGEMRSNLRLGDDRMKNVNATDSPALDKGTQRANDSFYFWKFRHGGWTRSRARLKRERVLPRFFFGGIAEGRKNGFAFIPVRKLIGIVAAAKLAGLSRGEEEDGFVPVSGVADEAHGGTVSLGGRAHAVLRSRLWLVRNAQKALQHTLATDGMKHVKGVEALPFPVFHAFTLALLSQTSYSFISGSG